MKSYVGCKIINAKKVKLKEYLMEKYGEVKNCKQDLDKEVYMVVYPPIGDDEKSYVSMSPVKIFEKCYREIETCEKDMITNG